MAERNSSCGGKFTRTLTIRVNVHQWSYGRLIDTIKAQALKVGIVIEQGEQPIRGSPQEKAKNMGISAYHVRSSP